MSKTQKASYRGVLKRVENNIQILASLPDSMVTASLDKALQEPTFSQMTPTERFTFYCQSHNVRKRIPIHHHANWTKVHIPRGQPSREPVIGERPAKPSQDQIEKIPKNRVILAASILK